MTPEEKRARKKAYREANKEQVAAKNKAYYEANKEQLVAHQKAYVEANAEKVVAQRKAYYEANKEKYAARNKASRAELKPSHVAVALKMPVSEVPPELLELKRDQLRLVRMNRELKKELKNV